MTNQHVGIQSIEFEQPPYILYTASAGGMLEQQGPLGKSLDIALSDEMNHEDSWEKAESQMVLSTIRRVIQKSGLDRSELQYVFAGDLMNQLTASGFCNERIKPSLFWIIRSLFNDGRIFAAGVYGSCGRLRAICGGRSVQPFLRSGKTISAASGLWRTKAPVFHADGDR